MKNLTSLAIALIMTTLPLLSQNTKEVLYLKNGSMIYGTVTEISDNQYKIVTGEGSLFVFQASEVDKYVRHENVSSERKKSGVGFALEGGFMLGPQATDYVAPFSFNLIGSYTVNTKNVFGVGSGAEFLGKTYTPVFFEYKGYLTEKNIAPFVFFRGGVLMYLGDNDETSNGGYYPQYSQTKSYSGGGSFAAGTGISWVKSSFETYLSFAYRYAHTSYKENNYNGYPVTYNNNFNRLEIKFGFKF